MEVEGEESGIFSEEIVEEESIFVEHFPSAPRLSDSTRIVTIGDNKCNTKEEEENEKKENENEEKEKEQCITTNLSIIDSDKKDNIKFDGTSLVNLENILFEELEKLNSAVNNISKKMNARYEQLNDRVAIIAEDIEIIKESIKKERYIEQKKLNNNNDDIDINNDDNNDNDDDDDDNNMAKTKSLKIKSKKDDIILKKEEDDNDDDDDDDDDDDVNNIMKKVELNLKERKRDSSYDVGRKERSKKWGGSSHRSKFKSQRHGKKKIKNRSQSMDNSTESIVKTGREKKDDKNDDDEKEEKEEVDISNDDDHNDDNDHNDSDGILVWIPLAQQEVETKNRKWRLKHYKNCFVASELVDWIILNGYAPSRIEATNMGQEAVDKKYIRHVVKASKRFTDNYLFFRWLSDDHSPSTEISTSDHSHITSESSDIELPSYVRKSVSQSKFMKSRQKMKKQQQTSPSDLMASIPSNFSDFTNISNVIGYDTHRS